MLSQTCLIYKVWVLSEDKITFIIKAPSNKVFMIYVKLIRIVLILEFFSSLFCT